MAEIGKKELKHLAELARIELHEHEEEKLLADLKKILAHFDELKEVPTEGVESMAGGTMLVNVARQYEGGVNLPKEKARAAFPEVEKGFLKVPPVFE